MLELEKVPSLLFQLILKDTGDEEQHRARSGRALSTGSAPCRWHGPPSGTWMYSPAWMSPDLCPLGISIEVSFTGTIDYVIGP